MESHGFLSGKCKHGSSNFCTICDIEGHPERYIEKLLNEVVSEIVENTKQPLSGRLQSWLMAYKSATEDKQWNETLGEIIREPFYRPTERGNMLEIKDLHEFFRSEYAPVHEKPEHRLLIQNFIEFYNSRNAAQQSTHPTPPTSLTDIALARAEVILAKRRARKSAGG